MFNPNIKNVNVIISKFSIYSDNEFHLSVLGHEGYGKVILSNRQDIKIGDIVTFTLCNVCHDCIRCHGRIEQKCKNLTKVIIRRLILN